MRSTHKARLVNGTSPSAARSPWSRSLMMVVNRLLIFVIAAWRCERNHRQEDADSPSTRAKAIITASLSAFTDTANCVMPADWLWPPGICQRQEGGQSSQSRRPGRRVSAWGMTETSQRSGDIPQRALYVNRSREAADSSR